MTTNKTQKSIKIIRNKKELNTIEIEIFNESHTLGNLLSDRLLLDKRCTYAAYKVPHPLDEKMILKVSARKGTDNVIGLVNECVKSVISDVDELLKQIERNEKQCENM